MKIVIADTSALISLGHVNLISLITEIFGSLYIPGAVWKELMNYDYPEFDLSIFKPLESCVIEVNARNHLSMVMDYGESESVILYEELKADFLLIDDNKARVIAESFGVNCIGSIGLLIKAKEKGLIRAVRPVFQDWLQNDRYFSSKLLNKILTDLDEEPF